MSVKIRICVLCVSVVLVGFLISFVVLPVFAGDEAKEGKREPTAVATIKYPPPPVDPKELPTPVKKYVKMIADLCKTSDLSKQVPQLQAALDGLDKALPFYYENYSTRRVRSGDLREMHTNLLGDMHLGALWMYLNTNPETRFNAAGHFLTTRIIMYNLPDKAGPEFFSHEWEHQVYNGLYCISHGHRLPKAALAKKPNAP